MESSSIFMRKDILLFMNHEGTRVKDYSQHQLGQNKFNKAGEDKIYVI